MPRAGEPVTAMLGMPAPPPAPGAVLGSIEIDARYNGPEASANGGYACGRLAAHLPEPAEITLRKPPPLDRSLTVVADGAGGVLLRDGDELIAEGRPVDEELAEPPYRPTFEEAVEAARRHPGRGVRHPLSDCFVCGPERARPGDGLGVSPGPLAAAPLHGAAPFVPDASLADGGVVRSEVVWAALDCPSYVPAMWSMDGIALLGRLRARREREVLVGERLAAVGWTMSTDGRKRHTASALIDERGGVVARAHATWIELRGSEALLASC